MKHGGMTPVDTTSEYKVCAVDLFCGAGGLTNGLERSGIDVRLGIDIDPACSYPYTANNKAKFLLKSVEDVTADEIKTAFGDNMIRLLAGCAPCQTFSTYNQKATQDDKRWWLLLQFSRLITEVSPELVTMENVPNLVDQNVFKEFLQTLEDANYEVSYQVVNCADYGIPQHRKRLVLLASKLGPIKLLQPSETGGKPMTVREAIGNLPPLKAGEVSDIDPLHQCSSLSPINLRRIQASRPGGSWRDWDEGLIAECHKKKTGKTYPSVYGRMSWDEPAPTITTQFYGFGNGRFGHPEQDRALSLREGAILQSFPRDYKFTPPGEPIYKNKVGRLIGNAVPVKLGEVIGKSIIAHIAKSQQQREVVAAGGVKYA
jgi:DNA (cytosine-5)-methyltransferase 1